MARMLTILFIALIFEAIGVVFLSRGLKQIGDLQEVSVAGVARLVGTGVTNPHIVLGVFFEAIFFIGLLMLMSKADVSFVWPLTSLSFVVTTIAAQIYLHEVSSGFIGQRNQVVRAPTTGGPAEELAEDGQSRRAAFGTEGGTVGYSRISDTC